MRLRKFRPHFTPKEIFTVEGSSGTDKRERINFMDDKIKQIRFDSMRARNFFEEYLAFTTGPVDLKNLMDKGDVALLDVRLKADYDISHIPNAISIPKDELADNLDKLNKNATTVVYSYNQQCHLSVEAALILADYGYPSMILEGGFKTWAEDFRFSST